MVAQYKSFKEFYPFYLSEHMNPICRTLHFIGSALVIGLIIIVVSIWDYKVFNPFRKKYLTSSPILFKLNKIGDYGNSLVGVVLCLLGLYGILNDVHDKNEKGIKDIYNEIFHKNKNEEENK